MMTASEFLYFLNYKDGENMAKASEFLTKKKSPESVWKLGSKLKEIIKLIMLILSVICQQIKISCKWISYSSPSFLKCTADNPIIADPIFSYSGQREKRYNV